MRNNLYEFRVKKRLTQSQIAHMIGCGRAGYAAIENGNRDGKYDFWVAFQKAFNVPDAEMWAFYKNE